MRVKSWLSQRMKNRIKYSLSPNRHTFDTYKGKKKVIVCMGADYGNMGDVAITFAQMSFLKKCFPDCCVIEFPISSTYKDMKSLKSVVTRDDLITLVGGGNTSERYADIEECREFIIKKFSKNTIVSFPQSVEVSGLNSKFVSRMRRKYNNIKDLHFIAREKFSYEAYKKIFPDKTIELFPDIVLSMELQNEVKIRNIITLSMRHDKEKKLSNIEETAIKKELISYGYEVQLKDTQVKGYYKFTIKERKKLLGELIDQYKKSMLVVTDRLHGMILSYITNTPCIVFAGDNNKIAGCYEWIKNSDQIIFMEKYDRKVFNAAVEKMMYQQKHLNSAVDFEKFKVFLKKVYV